MLTPCLWCHHEQPVHNVFFKPLGSARQRRIQGGVAVVRPDAFASSQRVVPPFWNSPVPTFLAPSLVQAAIEGRLARGIGVTRLRDAPAEWSRQYAMLGLSV